MAYDWIQRFPAHVPTARFNSVMAWDGSEIVMYGGRTHVFIGPGFQLGDTWTWDGVDWTERSPAHDPGVLEGAGIAYDIANEQVVLFGGIPDVTVPSAPSSETWVWDGTDWTQLSPAHHPSARQLPSMAYDEIRHKIVLFSGVDGSSSSVDDTWTWDGTDWTQEAPAHSPYDPGAANQVLGTLAWDPTNGVVVHTPTFVSGVPTLHGTWTWDGTDWTQITPAHSPAGIEDPGFATWRVGGKPLSFGGRNAHTSDIETNGTYTWDGSDWTQVLPAHSPGSRTQIAHQLAYDETRREVLLFGGLVGGQPEFSDTWVYADTGPYTLHLET